MSASTMAEQIIASHAEEEEPQPGEIVVARIDLVMAQDGNAPLAIKLLREKLCTEKPFDAARVVLVIDHCSPSPNESTSELQKTMREFCAETGARLFDIGQGISHVVLPESGYVTPGTLIVGSDSHTVTYGALNCLGTGMGATDIAVAIATGTVWLRVPEAHRIVLEGTLPPDVSAKDATLALVSQIGVDGATYRSLEFDGDGVANLDMDGRFTICNMGIEMGAKCALMPFDAISRSYLDDVASEGVPVRYEGPAVRPDPGAEYVAEARLNLSGVDPLVALPHDLTRIEAIADLPVTAVTHAFLGTCTNGRISDLRAAARVLKGRHLAPGVNMIVTPGSKQVLREAIRQGLVDVFLEADAVITTPGCGSCIGTHQGVPATGDFVISSANRNFKGRMGNPNAAIALGSPETVAASAVLGRIASAREL